MMNKKDMTALFGSAYGFNTDRRSKPVHFATGFFLALTGQNYQQQVLNKTVAFADGKELQGDYALQNLHTLLVTDGKIDAAIDLIRLQVLRKHLRCLVDNDEAVFPSFGGKGGFGCDYSGSSGDFVTRLKDNDGFSGFFVWSVLNQTPQGREVLEFAKQWIEVSDSSWRQVVAPLLDSDYQEYDSESRYQAKGLGSLESRRLKRVAKMMTAQTAALVTLCMNADILSATETKLRVLIVGMSIWLFRYLVREGIENSDTLGVVLVDMLGESSSKMRSQSRWSFSRLREALVQGFVRFYQEGRFDDCKAAWKHIQEQMAGRPKFDEFFRELTLRSGLAQPRASRIAAKHFELQPETLRVAVLSVISIDEGMISITDLLERLYKIWGLSFGGRPEDGSLLEKIGYSALDQDQDLTPNTEALISLLKDLGLATRFSDGLIMCHAKDAL
jgi:hypothetical protein